METKTNNPLKQYFRRPALYIKLPSEGKGYAQGVVSIPENGEIPVYPMTAIDEITAKTPDALFNGTAVTELMKSCIPDIKDPWSINSTDLDSILIAIKAASGGSELELDSQCPSCNNDAKYGINLVGVLATMKAADYAQTLKISDLEVKFRPLTYKEMNEASIGQFEVQRIFAEMESTQDDKLRTELGQKALKSVTELTMKILSKTIEFIQTPTARVTEKEFIFDFLQNCDKKIYVSMRDFNADLKTSAEIQPLDVKCINCGHQYKQPFTLNPSDFFG